MPETDKVGVILFGGNYFLKRNFRVADLPRCSAHAITEKSTSISGVKEKWIVAFPATSVMALAMGALLEETGETDTLAPATEFPSSST